MKISSEVLAWTAAAVMLVLLISTNAETWFGTNINKILGDIITKIMA